MLTFLDNCPIFVLQALRGKTLLHCERSVISGTLKSCLTLGPGTALWIHYSSSALLTSPLAAETLLLQHIFFLFVEMSSMKTSWQPDISAADAQYWDRYCSKSLSTEWSAPSVCPWVVPKWGVWRECASTTGLLFRGCSIGQRNESKFLMQNLTKSKQTVLWLGSKNPILDMRNHQDTRHLFRVRSKESWQTSWTWVCMYPCS